MNRKTLMASVSFAAMVAPFADEQPNNAVQLRKLPPNGGNINNAPEVTDVVTIVTPAGNVRINATDYDPATHTLAEGETAPASAAPAPDAPPVAVPPSNTPPDPNAPATGNPPPAPPSAASTPPPPPVEKYVTKIDKLFHVTDKDGKPLDAAHPGFKTEAEAQAAVKG